MIEHHEALRQRWFVAATSKSLRTKPVARTVLGTPVVLFRSHGKAVALLDSCPHRHAPLSAGKVVDNDIQCPYHGWRFDGDGACVMRPGVPRRADCDLRGAKAFSVEERHGLAWVNLSPAADAEDVPTNHWSGDPSFAAFVWTSTVRAAFVDAIENLLDATHTPFVHSGLVRSEANAQQFRATVRLREGTAEAEYFDEGKQAGWVSRLFEKDRASSFGRFVPPCIAELEYNSSRGTEFVLNSHFTPAEEGTVEIYSVFFVRRTRMPMVAKRLLLTPFFRRILTQDSRILSLQQRNIHRLGNIDYTYWQADLLRPLIEAWIENGKFPEGYAERTVHLSI